MTEQQAIKRIKTEMGWESEELNREAFEMGINALEKQIAKKPIYEPENGFILVYHCPSCKGLVAKLQGYCDRCGQRLGE